MIETLDDHLQQAKCLIVAFTGVSQALGGIPFEFYKSLSSVDCAPLFVRDKGQRWYQYDRDTIAAIVNKMNEARSSIGAQRICCIGNSMGGFAALLFGGFVDASSILAFSPQSAIAPEITEALSDRRWVEFQKKIPHFLFGDLVAQRAPTAKVAICYGANDRLDAAHTRRLRQVWNFEEIVVSGAGHNAAAILKERGDLLPLIRRIFDLERESRFCI